MQKQRRGGRVTQIIDHLGARRDCAAAANLAQQVRHGDVGAVLLAGVGGLTHGCYLSFKAGEPLNCLIPLMPTNERIWVMAMVFN